MFQSEMEHVPSVMEQCSRNVVSERGGIAAFESFLAVLALPLLRSTIILSFWCTTREIYFTIKRIYFIILSFWFSFCFYIFFLVAIRFFLALESSLNRLHVPAASDRHSIPFWDAVPGRPRSSFRDEVPGTRNMPTFHVPSF